MKILFAALLFSLTSVSSLASESSSLAQLEAAFLAKSRSGLGEEKFQSNADVWAGLSKERERIEEKGTPEEKETLRKQYLLMLGSLDGAAGDSSQSGQTSVADQNIDDWEASLVQAYEKAYLDLKAQTQKKQPVSQADQKVLERHKHRAQAVRQLAQEHDLTNMSQAERQSLLRGMNN